MKNDYKKISSVGKKNLPRYQQLRVTQFHDDSSAIVAKTIKMIFETKTLCFRYTSINSNNSVESFLL